MPVYVHNWQKIDGTSINKFTAATGFYELGYEVIPFTHVSELPELTQDDIFVGFVDESEIIMRNHGIDVPDVDYPMELDEFYGRKIWLGKIGDVTANPDNFGLFVKPKAAKRFQGRVINDFKDMIGITSMNDEPAWISEPIKFAREWRAFIMDGRVIDVRPYWGDYRYADYDASVIDQAIELWKDAPRAYSIDIGLTYDGKTLIIEVNDGYAIGAYGLMPTLYAQFLEARWLEIMSLRK